MIDAPMTDTDRHVSLNFYFRSIIHWCNQLSLLRVKTPGNYVFASGACCRWVFHIDFVPLCFALQM